MTVSPISHSNEALLPAKTLPIAPTDPKMILNITVALEDHLRKGDYVKAIEVTRVILSSGQVLAAKAFLEQTHADFLLPVVDLLINAIDSKAVDFTPDTRYLLARALRLYTELISLRSLKESGTMRQDRINDVLNRLPVLIEHAEDQKHPGLKFQLRCVQQGCKRWIHKDRLWSHFGSRMFSLIIKAASLDLSDMIEDALSLIRDLRKEKSKSWYDQAFYLGFLGSLATKDEGIFREVYTLIKEAYDRCNSQKDKKLLHVGVCLLSDLAWRGSPQIKSYALSGFEGGPGLLQLATARLSQAQFNKPQNLIRDLAKTAANQAGVDSLALWQVRYHGYCLLSALKGCDKELPDRTKISDKVTAFLTTRKILETHPTLTALLNSIDASPPKIEYASFFDIPEALTIDEAEQLEQQKLDLAAQEALLRHKQDELYQKEQELGAKQQDLADVQEEKRKLEQEQTQSRALLAQIAEQKTALEKLTLKLDTSLIELDKRLEPEEKQWPHAEVPIDRELPLPLKALYVHFQKRHYGANEDAAFIAQGIQYHIPLQTKEDLKADDSLLVADRIDAFLASDKSLLLLGGDSGAGKSLYMYLTERMYWDSWQQDHRVPCLIDLKQLKGSLEDALLELGYTNEQIPLLKQNYQFLFLLDGFDEMSQQIKILPLLEGWNCKVIVTCRTQYLGEHPDYWDRYFAPSRSRNDFSSFSSKNECFLTPLTLKQIDDYLVKLGAYEYFVQAKRRFPKIEELITTPLMLRLIAETLPLLLRNDHIDRFTVYEKFMEIWFQREWRRLDEVGSIKDFQEFAEELAFKMYLQNTQKVQTANRAFATFFSNENPQIKLARAACPLRRIKQDTFIFVHKSFTEYFVAQYLTRMLSPIDDANNNNASLAPEESPFNIPKTNQIGSEALLCSEPAILDFLAESMEKHPENKKLLLRLVFSSRENPQVQVAAANAITLLNRMRFCFSGLNLQGIQVPYANLDGTLMHWTDLAGANLKGANLRRAQLVGTNLRQANLEEVELGQRPMLICEREISAIAHHPTKDHIAIGLDNGNIEIWDPVQVKRLKTLKGHTKYVTSICYSPDGKQILSGSWDKTVRQWSVETGKETLRLDGHRDWVRSVCYSPDGKQILSGSYDQTVRQWSVETGKETLCLRGHTGAVASVCYSRDGKQILSGSYDQTVRQWSIVTGKETLCLRGHTEWVTSICYSPDGKQILSGSWDHTVRQWSVETGEETLRLDGHRDWVRSVCYSLDGKQILSGSYDETVRQWSVETGEETLRLRGHTGWVTRVCYSPDGKQILLGSEDKTVRQWSVETREETLRLEGHTGSVTTVCYSRDGKQILSGSEDKTICIWDAKTGKKLAVLYGHTDSVNSVSWNAFDELLSGSSDHTLAVWKRIPTYAGEKWCMVWHSDPTDLIAQDCTFQEDKKISRDNIVLLEKNGAMQPLSKSIPSLLKWGELSNSPDQKCAIM